MDHSSWAVTLGSLTCKEGGNLSTRDLGFIHVSSEGRVGCEFIHLAQPMDAPSSRRSFRSHFYTPGFPPFRELVPLGWRNLVPILPPAHPLGGGDYIWSSTYTGFQIIDRFHCINYTNHNFYNMSLYFYLPLIELSSDFCNNFVPGILGVEALFEEICCKQNQIYIEQIKQPSFYKSKWYQIKQPEILNQRLTWGYIAHLQKKIYSTFFLRFT